MTEDKISKSYFYKKTCCETILCTVLENYSTIIDKRMMDKDFAEIDKITMLLTEKSLVKLMKN